MCVSLDWLAIAAIFAAFVKLSASGAHPSIHSGTSGSVCFAMCDTSVFVSVFAAIIARLWKVMSK